MPRLLQGHSIQPWTASAGQSSSKGCGAPEGSRNLELLDSEFPLQHLFLGFRGLRVRGFKGLVSGFGGRG